MSKIFSKDGFAPPGVSPALPLLTELSPPSPLVTRSSKDPKLTLPPIGDLRGGIAGSRGGGAPLVKGEVVVAFPFHLDNHLRSDRQQCLVHPNQKF